MLHENIFLYTSFDLFKLLISLKLNTINYNILFNGWFYEAILSFKNYISLFLPFYYTSC